MSSNVLMRNEKQNQKRTPVRIVFLRYCIHNNNQNLLSLFIIENDTNVHLK